MLLTALVYLLIPAVWKQIRATNTNTLKKLALIGWIVALHWLTFYGSIKVGNSVSITLACLGSASFFTAIFEPLITKKPFVIREIYSGILVLIGVTLISISLPNSPTANVSYPWALVLGIISAALAALFSTLNKKHINEASPLVISSIEMLSGALILSFVMMVFYSNELLALPQFQPQNFRIDDLQNGAMDLLWLLILSIVCTNLTFYLATIALNKLSAFSANLIVNLEPVYGIVLGIFIFKENQDLNNYFYGGTILILGAIFMNSYNTRKIRKHDRANQNT
jgi:drug/metabolite transporter (DMT)-like permease